MNDRDERERPFVQPLSDPLLRAGVSNPDHVADFRAMLIVDPIQAAKYGQPPDRDPLLLLRVVQETKHVCTCNRDGMLRDRFQARRARGRRRRLSRLFQRGSLDCTASALKYGLNLSMGR